MRTSFLAALVPLLLLARPAVADEAQETIEKNRSKVSACYEKLRETRPFAAGDVEIKWHVDQKGKTSDVRVISATLRDESFHQCIKKQIGTWKFPKGVGPDELTLTYTFGLSPAPP